MALKRKITKAEFEALSEALQGIYTASGDEYVLDAEGDGEAADLRKKLDEFRANNIEARKKVEELEAAAAKFKGVDPEKYAELMAKAQEIEDKKLLDEKGVEALLEERTARMRADFDGQTEALTARTAELEATLQRKAERLNTLIIDVAVADSASKVGVVRQGALEDIKQRARRTWQLDDEDNPVPMDGDKVVYGKDGKSPLTMDEWAGGLITDAPFLFEASKGGGAEGGREGRKVEKGTLDGGDRRGFSANLEDIAKGKVVVQATSTAQ